MTTEVAIRKKIKIVPKDLKLTPIVLAYWIAGDGSWDRSRNAVKICTNGFTENEVKFLIDNLLRKLDISSKLVFAKKNFEGPMISVNKENSEKMQTLLFKHLKEMKTTLYKIGL